MINAFQRALLGLARAGQRDLEEMAGLLGLEAEFAELVRDDLRTLKYLDEFGAITAAGAAALADGFLDPQRIVVTHVYQDPMTGALWPATVPTPMLSGARWPAHHRAELDIGTAGNTAPIRALAVPLDRDVPDAPTADEVVEAVSRGSQATPGPDEDAGWRRRPPDRVAARVSLITSGQPVYLPVAILVSDGNAHSGEVRAGNPTWLAFSPFSRRASHMLRRLVAIRCAHYGPLRRQIESLTGRPAEALLAEYDQLGAELREYYNERLDRFFGLGLREHHQLVELLTLLELNTELGRKPGNRVSELNTAANAAWRVQEIVLLEIARRYPPHPGSWLDPAQGSPLWQRFMTACAEIGLRPTEYRAVSVLTTRSAMQRVLRLDRPNVPELLAAAVLSAQQGSAGHPVRQLARERDTLLTDLTNASAIRNDGSHAELTPIDPDAVELSRRLAHETVAAFLGVPAPDASDDQSYPRKDPIPRP